MDGWIWVMNYILKLMKGNATVWILKCIVVVAGCSVCSQMPTIDKLTQSLRLLCFEVQKVVLCMSENLTRKKTTRRTVDLLLNKRLEINCYDKLVVWSEGGRYSLKFQFVMICWSDYPFVYVVADWIQVWWEKKVVWCLKIHH